jgi:hypothetical protein
MIIEDVHFADTFVNVGLPRENSHFARCQLQHTTFAILGRELSFYYLDLLRGEFGFRLDLCENLVTLVSMESREREQVVKTEEL